MDLMMLSAIILAGGYGTRMAKLFPNTPKALIPLCDEVLLERILKQLEYYQFDEVVVVCGYLGNKINQFVKLRDNKFKSIKVLIEKEQKGTSHALRYGFSETKSDKSFIIYSDTYFKIDFNFLQNQIKAGI